MHRIIAVICAALLAIAAAACTPMGDPQGGGSLPRNVGGNTSNSGGS